MASRRYTLPEPAGTWIESQVKAGRAKTEEDFLADLIEQDRDKAQKRAALNAEIDAGLASGFIEKSVENAFAEFRQRHTNAS